MPDELSSLLQYWNTADDSVKPFNSETLLCQTFTPYTDERLHSIILKLNRSGTVNNLRVSLYTVDGSNLPNTLLTYTDFDATQITEDVGGDWYEIPLWASYIGYGIRLAIVVSTDSTGTNVLNWFSDSVDTYTDTYGTEISGVNTGTWSEDVGINLFETWGEVIIPLEAEPITIGYQVGQSLTLPNMPTTVTQAKLTSTENSGSFEYFMNAGSGTLTQFNTGTITGATYVAGTVGSYAMNFVNTYGAESQGVTITNNSTIQLGAGDFSFSCWIKHTMAATSNQYPMPIVKDSTSGNRQSFNLQIHKNTTNKTTFETYTNAVGNNIVGVATNDGNWHHIVCVKTATQLFLYIDNVLYSGVVTTIGDCSTTANLGFGRKPSGSFGYTGSLDEVLFFNRAINSTEVATLYAKGVVTSGLIAKYSFEEGSGTKAYDTSVWEKVNNGVLHTFEKTGNDLRYKIVEKLGSTGSISKVQVDSYNTPNTTPFATTQTALDQEYYRTLFDTYDTSTNSVLNSTWNVNSVSTSLQGIKFTELGTFNAASTGTMFTRYVIPEITLDNTHNYRFTIQTTLSDASSFTGIATTAGLNKARSWFNGSTTQYPNYLAFGTGTTAVAIGDTTLEGEQVRNAIGSYRIVNNTVLTETLLTYSQANGQSITKTGMFDASSVGTLWFEQKFNAIAKANTFQIDETDQTTFN